MSRADPLADDDLYPENLVLDRLGDRRQSVVFLESGQSRCRDYDLVRQAMLGLVFSQDNTVLYFFPIGFAITMGTAPLNWALIGDSFGRGSYATIRGIMGIGYGTATFVSPIYAGWIFDRTESYTLVLITFAIILLIAATFFAILHRPSPPQQR